MVLPLSSTLVYAFHVSFEKIWLQHCSSGFKLYNYRWYVDDIFVLFTLPEHLEAFRNSLNGRHISTSFTIENEKQNRMS